MELGSLGMPLCCFPRVFLSSCSTWSSGRGGGASDRAFGARELASVSSVHSWTGGPGVATFSVPVGFPSSSLHARRGDGAGESLGRFFSVFGCLSRLISARSVWDFSGLVQVFSCLALLVPVGVCSVFSPAGFSSLGLCLVERI